MVSYIDVHPVNPQPRNIARVAGILRDGGLIAYPTDSGYALGCALDNRDGLDRIRAIRKLDQKHHFTLMCRDFAQLGQFVIVGNAAFRTIKALTPGPYTFILKATKEVPRRTLHAKRHSVGVRIPDNRVTLDLVEEMGEPILSSTLILPSEDASDPQVAETTAWEIEDKIGHALDAIIDGGDVGGEPTTVVDFSEDEPVIRREGAGDLSRFS